MALYVPLVDIRAEGIDVSALSDDRAEFLSAGWQAWIEAKTGNWFESRAKTYLVDGNGSRVIWLNVPIITITELYTNGDFDTPLDSSYYVVYNRRFPVDDRKNPSIKLVKETSDDFFSFQLGSAGVFAVGDQNQKIVGTFGYTEEDGSVPFPIYRAIMTMIVLSADTMGDGDIDILRGGKVTDEVTDRHRIRFANLYKDIGAWATTGISDVDDAIRMYKRPAAIRTPRTWG